MTEFVQLVWQIGKLTVVHLTGMFIYLTVAPFLISPLLQGFLRNGRRQKLLRNRDRGWRSVGFAAALGFCSPPNIFRSFTDARRLFADGVSPLAVLTYLIATHSLLVYFVFLIPALSGPQPFLGLVLASAVMVGTLALGIGRIPAEEWVVARERLNEVGRVAGDAQGRPRMTLGSGLLASAGRLYGDVKSLGWPVLYGLALGALVGAWGLGSGFFSIAGDRGAIVQVSNAVAGLAVAAGLMVPAVGNVLAGGWLWKTEFFTYSGLIAFYLGALATPIAYRGYGRLFGKQLGRRVYGAVALSVVISAVVVTGFWYGVDGVAGIVGVRESAEGLLGSTIRPSDVPWFHQLFQGGEHAGMSGM